MGLERCSTADRVIGGAYLVVAATASGVAGAEAGQVAAVAIAGATVGLPAVVAGVWSLASYQVSGGSSWSEDGYEDGLE